MHVIISAILFLAFIVALVDVIRIPESDIKNLNKIAWVFIIILLPLIGTVLWFAVGREYSSSVSLGSFGDPRRRAETAAPSARPSAPRTIEEELAAIDREIEYHENEARIRRLEQELRDKQNKRLDP